MVTMLFILRKITITSTTDVDSSNLMNLKHLMIRIMDAAPNIRCVVFNDLPTHSKFYSKASHFV